MRKKFTLLFASLLAFAGVAKAGVADLPEMSTEGAIKYYAIKNTRSNKYANFAGDATKMTQTETTSLSSVFYFTAATVENAVEGFTSVMIHNAATDNMLADFESWTAEGKAWFLVVDSLNETPAGLHIVNAAKLQGWNAFNDQSGTTITNYLAKDGGSIFVLEELDLNNIINSSLNAYKATAIAALDSCVAVKVLSDVTAEKAAVNAVTLASVNSASLNKAIAEVDAVIAEAFAGKYYTINTPARADKGYMQMGIEDVKGAKEAVTPAAVWQFSYSNGGINVYNPYTGKYLCTPINENYKAVPVTTKQAEAGAYILNRSSKDNAEDGAIVKFTSNGLSFHMEGTGYLVRWNDGDASEWNITEITDFTTFVDLYQAATVAALDELATLSVIFDAALVADTKDAVNAITSTDWATFAAIDAAMEEFADVVSTKNIAFQTMATDNGRNGVWVSANNGKAIGADNQDYNAIWNLKYAGNKSFFVYNPLNNLYLGGIEGPANDEDQNTPLTENPEAAYTFEIITDIEGADNVVELKNDNKTLHASNHHDDKLLNWDGNEAASRWFVKIVNVSADISDLLATITAEDYADVPELGQYTTAAYNALVEAEANAETVVEVYTAINKFEISKNMPVFTIDGGAKDYVVGKSIYLNEEGVLQFKTTDATDHSMLWAFDMTENKVGVIEEVVVRNVATGELFWNAPYITVTETNENENAGIADDDIFLFHTAGNNTPVHAQENGSSIVRYGSLEANSGSAWKFTYVGTTYEINKLGESTGIESVEKTNAEVVIYDLTGRRVQKMEKGIYIVNGKKVLVK